MPCRPRKPWQLLFVAALGLAASLTWSTSGTAAEPTVHVVYEGQRLGSIAKRYNVSIDALCNANGIRPTDPIRPGQRLYIPGKDDPDGSLTQRIRDRKENSPPSASAPPSPRTGAGTKKVEHVVGPGHTLGKIANRYHVSVAALCQANGISETTPIRPGQALVIPDPNARVGAPKDDRESANPPPAAPAPAEEPKRPPPVSARAPIASAGSTRPVRHVVGAGHTLGKVATRYHVSIDALCTANGIERRDPIRPGQVLWIPGPGDTDGSAAASLRKSGALDRSSAGRSTTTKTNGKPSWYAYRKTPWRRGFITLVGYQETWKGYVIGPQGEVLPAAHQAICRLMGADGDHPRVDRRLVQLLVKVSDTFGGRPIRVVSGFRSESYALNSRHRRSQAIDFSIPGVPNEVLRDYLLSFDRVGVGYYPNSSFVHFDVRETKTYWVDLSGPGESPRYLRRS
ncbi:MAG: LysM peptidoglycan-binding domain-containing protein [Polyangiaceae bacterium]|nr:LysM peptidoglycan-binding domain-containing protein [Polyangiaceae bacterium]